MNNKRIEKKKHARVMYNYRLTQVRRERALGDYEAPPRI